MLAEVRRTIKREGMPLPGHSLWVAVSGGVDSMVLLQVLCELGYTCSVAHVNHGLRGKESDGDSEFVEAHARRLGLPFRAVGVDPLGTAGQGSLQMTARELRYAWFKELLREGPSYMAMGHHRDDAAETLLLHLMRGIGANGWEGIPPVTLLEEGMLCRPLIAVGREQIAEYAREMGIAFREDASNTSPKYLRNRVRHELIPLMEQMRPGTRNTLARSLDLLKELGAAAGRELDREAGKLSALSQPGYQLPLRTVRESPAPRLLLMRFLHGCEHHPDLVGQLLEAVRQGATGARFRAGEWWVSITHDGLVKYAAKEDFPSYSIGANEAEQGSKGPFRWMTSFAGEMEFQNDMNTVHLNRDRLEFPLQMRPWCKGDRMRPVGLGGSKLISDILVDAKVPRHLKAGQYVVLSGSDIIWLPGLRLAEGYGADSTTKSVLRLEFSDLGFTNFSVLPEM